MWGGPCLESLREGSLSHKQECSPSSGMARHNVTSVSEARRDLSKVTQPSYW